MNSAPDGPGFYGKFPILGDFVSRRLPAEFIRPWDGWLQECLTTSRDQLGAAWLDIYLTSPIWRFILRSGVNGAASWAGVLMPSVDQAGRYFPLTIAAQINVAQSLPELFITAGDWFERLELLALSGLAHEFDLDLFNQKVQQETLEASSPPACRHCADDRTEKDGKPGLHIEMDDLSEIKDAVSVLNSCMLARLTPACSFWSTHGSERVKPSLLVYEGLPPATAYAEFLSGEWRAAPLPNPIAVSRSAEKLARQANTASLMTVAPDNPLQWRSSGRTITGRREINEDALLDRPEAGLWVVADGMGGHSAGEVASRAVADSLGKVPASDSIEVFKADVTACLQRVNNELLAMAAERGPGTTIGSTVVVMVARGNQAAVLWVGDSRLYRYQGGALSQLSRDHSLVAELSRQGAIREQRAGGNINSNIITRALGAGPELAVDSISFTAQPGDIYLLCSDGLIREVQDEEISTVLRGHERDQCAPALVELALERGARDNVTVILVWPEPVADAAGARLASGPAQA